MSGTVLLRNVETPDAGMLNAVLHGTTLAGLDNSGVLASVGRGLDAFCTRHGGDLRRVFLANGIDPDLLGAPLHSLSLVDYCRALESAATDTRIDTFGLLYGHERRPQALGLIGYIGLNSPTVLDALQNLVADFPWHQRDTFVRLVETETHWRFDYQIRHGAITIRRQDAELTLATLLNLLRHALGPTWSPSEVHFEHPQPGRLVDHTRCFGAPLWFNQPVNAMLISKKAASAPMPGADPLLLSVLRAVIRGVAAPRTTQTVQDLARAHIRQALIQGEPRIEEIAEALGLSAHSLQRKLAEQQSAFSHLVDDLRFEMARHYLGQTTLSISETAAALGYSETSAFSRAFRRWAGASPRAYRSAQASRQRRAASCAKPRSSAPTSQSISPVWNASGGLSFSTFP